MAEQSSAGKKWVVRNKQGQMVSAPTTDVNEAMKQANQKNTVLEKAGKVPEFEVKEYLVEG